MRCNVQLARFWIHYENATDHNDDDEDDDDDHISVNVFYWPQLDNDAILTLRTRLLQIFEWWSWVHCERHCHPPLCSNCPSYVVLCCQQSSRTDIKQM